MIFMAKLLTFPAADGLQETFPGCAGVLPESTHRGG